MESECCYWDYDKGYSNVYSKLPVFFMCLTNRVTIRQYKALQLLEGQHRRGGGLAQAKRPKLVVFLNTIVQPLVGKRTSVTLLKRFDEPELSSPCKPISQKLLSPHNIKFSKYVTQGYLIIPGPIPVRPSTCTQNWCTCLLAIWPGTLALHDLAWDKDHCTHAIKTRT